MTAKKRPRTRLIEDLPENLQSVVTEHTIHRDYCPKCKKYVEPVVPDALPNATFGHRLISFTSWCHYDLGITLDQLVDILQFHVQTKLSAGALIATWQRLAAILTPWYEQLAQEARKSAYLPHAASAGPRPAPDDRDRPANLPPNRPPPAATRREHCKRVNSHHNTNRGNVAVGHDTAAYKLDVLTDGTAASKGVSSDTQAGLASTDKMTAPAGLTSFSTATGQSGHPAAALIPPICRFDQDVLQLRVVFRVGQIVCREIVRRHAPILGIENDQITVRDPPELPHAGVRRVLQPGQHAVGHHGGVTRFRANCVDAEHVDRPRGRRRVKLSLQLIEEAKLASAVTSGRMPEVPRGDLSQVIARRDRFAEARRIRVVVRQRKIGQGVGAGVDVAVLNGAGRAARQERGRHKQRSRSELYFANSPPQKSLDSLT
jgi:hypothetical protein